MNIYVDLEATQYSEESISIGAVTENGDTFYTLVKPKRMRCVTSFITELTGITKQMLQNPDVPNIYDAIHIFAKWCQKQGNNVVIYYYGDFDRVLFSRAFHYLKGITDYSSLGYILNRLVDVSDTLNYIVNPTPIRTMGIAKIHDKLFKNIIKQDHNALHDAEILKDVHLKLCKTPISVYKGKREQETLNHYIKLYNDYKREKLNYKTVKRYKSLFTYLDSCNINTVTVMDIGRYNNIIQNLEKEIKNDYLVLNGKEYDGYIYTMPKRKTKKK